MHALVVDDEQRSLDSLCKLIELYCDNIQEIRKASNLNEAETNIVEKRPDVLFLDVELGANKSFELFDKIDISDVPVIFTTAHKDYAVNAFRLSAIDFLLKPVDPDLLIEAVEKVKSALNARDQKEQFDALLYNLKTDTSQKKKIIINTAEANYVFQLKELLYCESKGNYTQFFHEDGRQVLVSKTLSSYDKQLAPYQFFRTHKSFLVNMQHVDRYDKREGGKVVLTNGNELPLADRRKEDFLEALASLS
ncbi:MAG: LytTR family DNA-binding domain-containing protein [Bacteroidota bacterium]